MKKVTSILAFLLVSFFTSAQSVLITPGAQSINGDSTIDNQLNAFGNGLLVGSKVKFTDDEPASNVNVMGCTFTGQNELLAGTLKDPSGDADYTGGVVYDCSFGIINYDPLFLAYQIDFELLDTELDGDTVFIIDGSTVLASFSGNSLPPSLRVSANSIIIEFKTDNTGFGGAGFVLKWKAILRDDTPAPIQNYTGEGLVYDVASHSLWTGKHNPVDFVNKGIYSIAMGFNTTAGGIYSTAMGNSTTANGSYSTAIGRRTKASGLGATALGRATSASGNYSIATGSSTTASGDYSSAMGLLTTASGFGSTAMGDGTTASGDYSTSLGSVTKAIGQYSTAMGGSTRADTTYATAMGKSTTASGFASTAMGNETTASGYASTALGNGTEAETSYSTAMGKSTTAGGYASTAMGDGTTASGDYSTAMGENTAAIGNNSTAIGTDVTANGYGTLIIGDSNPGGAVYTSGTNDKFIGRFYNGYYFLTSATGATARGVQISHDQTAWSSISDSTKKENFIPAEGDKFLEKLKDLRLGSWNYKTQEQNPERFYGPMAQEIYAAYGKDAIGTIGSDTLVSTLNMDGLLFIFVQELEKRTSELKTQTDNLRLENELLKKSNEALQQSFMALENSVKTEIMELKAYWSSSQKDKPSTSASIDNNNIKHLP